MRTEILLSEFEGEFKDLIDRGLVLTGVYGGSKAAEGEEFDIKIGVGAQTLETVQPGTHHISVLVPFIFDSRKLPKTFKGFSIKKSYIADTVPAEIDEIILDPAGFKTNWTPDQFRSYVHDNADKIKRILNQPLLEANEILDAICFGNFEEFCEQYEQDRIFSIIWKDFDNLSDFK